jgi:hypothetical protein
MAGVVFTVYLKNLPALVKHRPRLENLMPGRGLRKFVLSIVLFALVQGCSHPLEIVGEGDVLSATGTRNCYYEDYLAGAESCSKNLIVHEYIETYYAVPREGWQFDKWLNYCTNTTSDECTFNIPADLVKLSWGKTVNPLVAVFAKTAPPPPEPVAMYSYVLDAASGLLNPQPLEGAHIQRRSVYFSFTGDYSKATFWCCKVIGGDEAHMPSVTDDTAPFVLRVDTGALPDDGSLQRELYADLFDSSGNYTGHYANWTLEALADSPVVFDDGGVHTIDYTIQGDVFVDVGTTLNIVSGANIIGNIQLMGVINVYGGTISKIEVITGSLLVAGGEVDVIYQFGSPANTVEITGGEISSLSAERGEAHISGGTIDNIYALFGQLQISGGTIGELILGDETATAEITGGTFLSSMVIGLSAGGGSASIKGGTFNGGFVFYTYRSSSLEFYGDLVLTWSYFSPGNDASGDITGTLLDGMILAAGITCFDAGGTEEEPCPGLTVVH